MKNRVLNQSKQNDSDQYELRLIPSRHYAIPLIEAMTHSHIKVSENRTNFANIHSEVDLAVDTNSSFAI